MKHSICLYCLIPSLCLIQRSFNPSFIKKLSLILLFLNWRSRSLLLYFDWVWFALLFEGRGLSFHSANKQTQSNPTNSKKESKVVCALGLRSSLLYLFFTQTKGAGMKQSLVIVKWSGTAEIGLRPITQQWMNVDGAPHKTNQFNHSWISWLIDFDLWLIELNKYYNSK